MSLYWKMKSNKTIKKPHFTEKYVDIVLETDTIKKLIFNGSKINETENFAYIYMYLLIL